ncbi:MAG TPA: hypothetical protein VM121_12105 [Acidimicrobiales bacterium]|nr:hypothetical protein [Acidimicrobiales bacterium]
MKKSRLGRRWLRIGLVLSCLAVTFVIAEQRPALASHDGAPSIGTEGAPVPAAHRPAGGSAVRIYGERLLGTTSVTIGGVPAPDFRVVDGDLIIATVPPVGVGILSSQNDGYAHITVTDDQGTTTTDLDGDGTVDLVDCVQDTPGQGCYEFGPEFGAIFYTDATIAMSPQTGLDGGETATVTVTNHRPNQGGWPVVQLNPLINFLEDGPDDPDTIPPGPPYGTPLSFSPTDGNGNIASTNVTIPANPTFNAKDFDYDDNARCPVKQTTADFGLDRCLVAYTEFGMGTVEKYFNYSPDVPHLDPTPASPTLNLNPTSGAPGSTVSLSGSNWSAAPLFGSDTTVDDPGESPLTVEICNTALTTCAPAASPDADVAPTRYFDSGPDPDVQPVSGVFTGATLSGTFRVANTQACAPTCRVRVRQQRHDIETNALVPGSFITATANLSVRAAPPGDFDADARTDVGVFRPAGGTWFVNGSGGAATAVGWGTSTDLPVPGDYDGDGDVDVAVFRPSDGAWYVKGGVTVGWGTSGDIPVPGDYDGDGDTDIAVFRPSNGVWFVKDGITASWGTSGDIPVPGDYDGDGDTDIAVFRPSNGVWFVKNGITASWGTSGDIPVPGDYDADGDADVAIFRPSDGVWYVKDGTSVGWGNSGDVPVPGDYDGDGDTDIAVFRPLNGVWFVRGGTAVAFGTAGDIPLPLPTAIHRRFF